MTELVTSFAAVRTATAHRGTVGLVPTMGYLHEGHLSLMTRARRDVDIVVSSVFVNPLQFNEASDLEVYPRNLDRDVALAAEAGVDIVFAPPLEEMYAQEPVTRVVVSALTETMEGLHRPGHFEGVATVVAKLFAGIQPDSAYFGRKDGQQLAVVRRLAADLSFPVTVVGCPIVRESSGLALSSRNHRLDEQDRQRALALSQGLMAAADDIEAGVLDAAPLLKTALAPAERMDGVEPEYAVLASQQSMQSVERIVEPVVLAVAAWVGDVRLIDNIHVDMVDGHLVVDRGVKLARPSILFAHRGGA